MGPATAVQVLELSQARQQSHQEGLPPQARQRGAEPPSALPVSTASSCRLEDRVKQAPSVLAQSTHAEPFHLGSQLQGSMEASSAVAITSARGSEQSEQLRMEESHRGCMQQLSLPDCCSGAPGEDCKAPLTSGYRSAAVSDQLDKLFRCIAIPLTRSLMRYQYALPLCQLNPPDLPKIYHDLLCHNGPLGSL